MNIKALLLFMLITLATISIGFLQADESSPDSSGTQPSAANNKMPANKATSTATSQTSAADKQKTKSTSATTNRKERDFKPSEEISEDYSVPFPVDI